MGACLEPEDTKTKVIEKKMSEQFDHINKINEIMGFENLIDSKVEGSLTNEMMGVTHIWAGKDIKVPTIDEASQINLASLGLTDST